MRLATVTEHYDVEIVPTGAGLAVEDAGLTVVEPSGTRPADSSTKPGAVTLVAFGVLAVVLVESTFGDVLSAPWAATWMTIFLSVLTQAMPFLVGGVLLSATIAVFVPAGFF